MSNITLSIPPVAQDLLEAIFVMPNNWVRTTSELPQESRYVILDGLFSDVFAVLKGDSWMLIVSPTGKYIETNLDLFPYWRYPTGQELHNFENLKFHNLLTYS